jgi:photosystem II stability/assembly factor-like uncharacterized protein
MIVLPLLLTIFSLLIKLTVSEWVAIPGPDQYSNFLAVTWPYDGTVLAAGYQVSGGSIIISEDFGVHWKKANLTDGSTFGSMYALASRNLDANTVTLPGGYTSSVFYLAVDDGGEIFGSTGDGKEWSLFASVPAQLYGVTIASNGYAFACGFGNKVYRSLASSGYLTWASVSPSPGVSIQFNDVSSVDGINVIIVGSRGSAYYSSNSGTSWTKGTNGLAITAVVYCVAHATTLTAFAGGDKGYVARTVNGGSTWTTLSVFTNPTTITVRFHAISTFQSTYVFVAGSNGFIYWSSDTGASWTLLVNTAQTIYSISMYDLTNGVAGAISGVGVYTLVPSKRKLLCFIFHNFHFSFFSFLFLSLSF